MNKREEFANMPSEPQHPTAPPSYDEAVMKQPAFNPYGYHPQMMTQNPVQTVPAYIPQPQLQPAPVVYTTAPSYPPAPIVAVSVGPRSATLECPHCRKTVKTLIHTENQKSAHIAALVLCLIGCYLCCCIPYCMSSFKDVHHTCPKCKKFIGTFKH